jgi:pimeloyl-ACP methyl ester carboxylesterase
METLEIAVGGGMTFQARAAGPDEGRLVLLLHGFPQTSAAWIPTMEALASAGHRAVAFDQRGYSPAARPAGVEHYALGHLVSDVIAVADQIGGHRFDLVGHDWGGAIAWHVAGQNPDRVRTLTVASTPHPAAFRAALKGELGGDQVEHSAYADFFRQPDLPEEMFLANDAAALRGVYAGLPDEIAEDYIRMLTGPGALTGGLNYYRATKFDEQGNPGTISSPTLFVWSNGDEYLRREAAEATGSHVEGPYRFEELDGVSHWIPETAADDFSRILLEHLAAYD